MTTQEKIIYLAGIIDGEGYIGINKSKNYQGKPLFKLRVVVCNTNTDLIKWLVDNFGGYITKKKTYSYKHKVSYNWKVNCDKAGDVLSLVLPYLIIKKRQAELAILYRELQINQIKTCPGKSSSIPLSMRIEICDMFKHLNSHGPESVETNTPNFIDLMKKIESELGRNIKKRVSDDLFVQRNQYLFVE